MNIRIEATPFAFVVAAAAIAMGALSLLPESSFASRMSGLALLNKADKIRNPSSSYRMRIEVKGSDDSTEFEVMLKGTDKTLIVTKEPAKDRGRNMLMLDRDFYAFVPDLKKSMRLSLAQKMTGLVANGDIARTRWSGDYGVTVESADPKETKLLLNASKKNLTYQKIRLWLDSTSARPLRAEYLSLDGKTVLKRAFFEDYKALAGSQRPGRIRIEDAGGKQSSITILDMEATELSDSMFTQAHLEKAK